MTTYQLDKKLLKCRENIRFFGWLSVGIVFSVGLILSFHICKNIFLK